MKNRQIWANFRWSDSDRWGPPDTMICAALIAAALLSDLFQMHGVVFSHDVRLWQLWVGIGGVLLVFAGRLEVPRGIMIVVGLVAAHSIVINFITGSVSFFGWLQLFLVTLTLLVCYSALRFNSAPKLVSVYLFCALVVCGSIFLELAVHLISPEFADATLYKFMKRTHGGPWDLIRAHGLMMEPSQVALLVPPALFVALMRGSPGVASVLVLGAALSFSALTYLGVLTAFVVYILVIRGVKVGQLLCVVLLTLCIAMAVGPVRKRVEWVFKAPAAMQNLNQSTLEEMHGELGGSVGPQVMAAKVMMIGFQSNGFLGTGMGDFKAAGRAFRKQISPDVWAGVEKNTNLDIKMDTGGSLLLRVLGEFGVFGLIILGCGVWYVSRSLIRTNRLCRLAPGWRYDPRVQAIGLFAVLIVPYLVRKGGYLNIYLLLPLVGYLLASSSLTSNPELLTDSVESECDELIPTGVDH